MLYEILSVILVLYAVLSPFWVIRAIKFGLSIVENPQEAAEEPVFTLPKTKKKAKSAELPKEIQQTYDILDNIETYDGTDVGQKEIKE